MSDVMHQLALRAAHTMGAIVNDEVRQAITKAIRERDEAIAMEVAKAALATVEARKAREAARVDEWAAMGRVISQHDSERSSATYWAVDSMTCAVGGAEANTFPWNEPLPSGWRWATQHDLDERAQIRARANAL